MSSAETGPGRTRLLGAAVALVLVVVVLTVAGPATVWRLLEGCDPGLLGLAAAAAAAVLLLRGLRLAVLLPALPPSRSIVVATAAQAAALFVPARAGELAMPWLLRRTGACDLATGVGILLVARTFDVTTLGVWAVAAVVTLKGLSSPVAVAASVLLLFGPPLALPLAVALTDRVAVRVLAPRGQRGRRWARRARRVNRALTVLRRRPARLVAASAMSLAMWAVVWLQTGLLLAALDYRWPASEVVAGSAAASLANLVPVNLVANLGTLEAGWTAAFTALGKPLADAAASGLATHLLALVLSAVYGGAAWLILLTTDGRLRVSRFTEL